MPLNGSIKKRPTFPWSADVRVSSLWLTLSQHQDPTGFPRGCGSQGSQHAARERFHVRRIYIIGMGDCQARFSSAQSQSIHIVAFILICRHGWPQVGSGFLRQLNKCSFELTQRVSCLACLPDLPDLRMYLRPCHLSKLYFILLCGRID